MKKKVKKSLLSFLVVTLLAGNLFFPSLVSAAPGIIFEDGFESGDFSAWTGTSTGTGDSLSVVSEDKHHNTYSAKLVLNGSGNDYGYGWKTFTAQPTVYKRLYVRFSSLFAAQSHGIIGHWGSDSVSNAILRVSGGNYYWRIRSRNGATVENTDSNAFAPDTNHWYCVELKTVVHGSAGEYRLYIDGIETITVTGKDSDDYGNIEKTYFGQTLGGLTLSSIAYFDSVIVSDSYIGCNPNSPSSVGPTNYVNGSWISDKTPTLQFTQSDPDSGDTVKYRIQIDNNSDFSSPVVDYTSDYISQGATSFTVGQAEGTGTYTQGSQGQTLTQGSYYWQVMSEDQNTNQSNWTKANSGNVAFKLSIAKIYTGVTNTIYANGTVSYSGQPNENNLINLNLVPSYGSITLTILTWQTSGEYLKEWTEDASQPGIVTDHTVGDLKPNTSYNILVDNTLFTKKTSDNQGEITFLYDGGYSERNFKIEQTPEELAPTGNNISYLLYLLPLTFLLIGFTLYFRARKTGSSLVR